MKRKNAPPVREFGVVGMSDRLVMTTMKINPRVVLNAAAALKDKNQRIKRADVVQDVQQLVQLKETMMIGVPPLGKLMIGKVLLEKSKNLPVVVTVALSVQKVVMKMLPPNPEGVVRLVTQLLAENGRMMTRSPLIM
jgi:hypothetical protein